MQPITKQSITCERCASESVQRFGAAYEAGTSTTLSTTTSSAVGFSGSGLFSGSASSKTQGESTTTLAAKLAPPQLKLNKFQVFLAVFSLACWAIVAYTALHGTTIPAALGYGLVSGIIAFFWIRSSLRWNRDVYPGLLRKWEQSWYCHKCGHCFIIEE